MKLLALVALIASVDAKSSTCMNCKLLDSTSSFMYGASWCPDTDECLKDEWDYINKWCPSKWIRGWMLDIVKDCQAEENPKACFNYKTEEGFVGPYPNTSPTSTLRQGQYCTMTVDAQASLGRVKLTEAVNLGVLWNNYNMNDPITIPKGNVQDITVYNGNPLGNLAFSVTLSGASVLQASTIMASSLAIASLY